MHRKGLARRLLGLLLAAQLLLMQVPMAFASSPEEDGAPPSLTDSVPEGNEPTREETDPTDDPATADALGGDVEQLTEEMPVYAYKLGYGVSTKGTNNRLTDYDDYFAVEVGDGYGYGVRDYTGNGTLPEGEEDDKYYTFCVFPNADALGRVPDRQFEGWYLLPPGPEKGSDAKAWHYNTIDPTLNPELKPPSQPEIFPYTKDDLNYETYSGLGDTWNGKRADYTAAGYHMTEEGYLNTGDPVSFVGRWVSSNVARAADKDGAVLTVFKADGTAAPAPALYAAPIAGSALPSTTVQFDPKVTDYYLRVGADVTALDLTFNAYEPYYDYNSKQPEERPADSPVKVISTFGKTTSDYKSSLVGKMLPEPTQTGTPIANQPNNSLTDPAHSQWTVTDIPLAPSAGRGALYNDIVVSVTSPDGEATTNYTFHVQRLAEPTLARNPGNTPAGMIARDTSAVWKVGGTEESNKEKGTAYFALHHRFSFSDKLFPQDATHNQGGSIFHGDYDFSAWLADAENPMYNLDLDPNAIVVYQDSAFLDPGISLTDAEGNSVTLGSGAYADAVKRTLKLRTADTLTVADINDGAGTPSWYTTTPGGGTLIDKEASETVSKADGSDQIDLRGLKVLPGIYTLEYSYTDPVSGETYDSAGGFTDPDWLENKAAFHRTLVVLPVRGDVDMDGAVTAADAAALKDALNLTPDISAAETFNGVKLNADATAALFAYRVCDLVPGSGLTQADLDELEKCDNPVLEKIGNSDYYYLPLPTGDKDSRYTRKPLEVVDAASAGRAAPSAKLTMKFLGKEQGIRQPAGHTLNPNGPDWTAAAVPEDPADPARVTLNDTFWLGVELSDSEMSALLDQNVKDFAFTLTYDERYVTPATVLNMEQWGSAGNDLDRWKRSMRIYNLGAGTQTGADTVWGPNYSYDFTAAAGPGKKYTTHYSKAITPLEANADEGSKLKELVFSIRLGEGKQAVNLRENIMQNQDKTGWLLAVPFTLVKHPYGQSSAQLVELGAGMREFVFAPPQDRSAFSLLDFLTGRSAAPAPAAAYSAQDEIFGGATENLRGAVGYVGAGAAIPLGVDKTETITLFNEKVGGPTSTANAVYSTAFLSKGGRGVLPMNGKLEGTLPPGLKYSGFEITGTPTRAGEYPFSIATTPYRIVVEKAPLHFWADNQTSYYGQPELRDEQSADFTFRYTPGDILSVDRAKADRDENDSLVCTGVGATLGALLTHRSDPSEDPIVYAAPAFTAETKEDGAVTASTDVGTYSIKNSLLPVSTNYEFIYAPDLAGGKLGLTILQRPFTVVKLADHTVVGEIYDDMPGSILDCKAALPATENVGGFVAGLPYILGQPTGTYKGYPLTPYSGTAADPALNGALLPDDVLTVSYTGEYVRLPTDNGIEGKFFILAEGADREFRDVNVEALALLKGGNASNYTLAEKKPTAPTTGDGRVTGSVRRRSIEKIEITQTPTLKYLHGEQLGSPQSLHFWIKKGAGAGAVTEGEFKFNPVDCAAMGISVTWATEEEMVAGKPGVLPYVGNQTFDRATYDGRYLCVSAPSVDANGMPGTIVQYSEEPLVITARTITLTAKPVERYYGEESGPLGFTYNKNQLAGCDSQKNPGLKGEGAELAEVLKTARYTPPTLSAQVSTTNSTPLTAATPYSGSNNAVVISGAKCDNYDFEYTRSAGGVSATGGDSVFKISKRLIVVDSLTEEKAQAKDLATVYADTKRIYTEKRPLALTDVKLTLPDKSKSESNPDGLEYFPTGGNGGKPLQSTIAYAENALPVLERDIGRLALTYTATVVPTDEGYHYYSSFAKGYYNMADADEFGCKPYPVQVGDLTLTGDASNNYFLVYKDYNSAFRGLPANTTPTQGVDPEVGTRDYWTSGSGVVKLRPIKEIVVTYAPKLVYTYGKVFAPTESNSATDRPMTVKLQYETAGDNFPPGNYPDDKNFPEGNTTSETVSCKVERYGEGMRPITSFEDRDLTICYLTPEQTQVDQTQTLTNRQALTVEPHDGARLAVIGRRGKNDPLITSNITAEALTVNPLTLTLTAADRHRFYGEPNFSDDDVKEFSFTFPTQNLAPQDLAALKDADPTITGDADERAGSEVLAALAVARPDAIAYTAPAGNTTAQQGSGVINGGKGSYPIQLSGGSLSNYRLAFVDGALHIYPRPVKIEKFISSFPENPIYTIYADTDQRIFNTDVDTSRFTMLRSSEEEFIPGMEQEDVTAPVTGNAIYATDSITLKIKVEYNLGNVDLGTAAGKEHTVRVTAAFIQTGTAAAANYKLEQNKDGATIVDRDAKGAVELRKINEIAITTPPADFDYTYGETLDLRGLMVTINYNIIGDGVETPKFQEVSYLGADQFAQYGLYVNYSTADTIPAEGEWEKIKDTYRKAETGDHLTVAPTHDAQMANAAFPGFTPNGKYLIVSAQRHKEQAPAAPRIVAVPIDVKPKALTFTLAAADKTYDGEKKAAGTLALTNVFHTAGAVDQYNQSGVTDMVYPVTHGTYENDWDKLTTGYTSFTKHVADKGYAFTTGTYVPADPAPLGANHPLKDTAGYVHGRGLTFNFLNANVAYQTPAASHAYGPLATVGVEATGITLGGPDAANYTIAGKTAAETATTPAAVTADNAATTPGYQGGALPVATIHKANRPKLVTDMLPQVEIDVHTGVVRLSYPQDSSAIGSGEAAEYMGELHFEYALQYDATKENIPAVAQWAGLDGTALWWDERYFGGEAVAPKIPDGYLPEENDIPKDEDIKEDTLLKGQLYQRVSVENGKTIRWSEEDTHFVLDPTAYPGGAAWPGHYRYKNDRAPLPRNAVLLPVVRAAETHNYNASPVLTSATEYTPELAQAVADSNAAVAAARKALDSADTEAEREEARLALDTANTAAQTAATAALKWVKTISADAADAAREESDLLLDVAESGKWPEEIEEAWPLRDIAPAVKSYAQRIDLVSTEEKSMTEGTERTEFTVPTLEAVWFTDILNYPERKVMDTVLRNSDPTRYYGYAWDSAMSAQIKFDDKENSFTLENPIDVEMKRRDEDGKEITETVTVNRNNTALVYVSITAGGGLIKEREVHIAPRGLHATVGDPPRTLTATIVPRYATYKKVTWTSSDPQVATVDKNGVVTFVGPGVATITATTKYRFTDSITVTVATNWREVYPNAIFDVGHLDAFFALEEDLFRPEGGMTRGEAAELLARFYVPNDNWKHTGVSEFPDLVGKDSYAAAVHLLGGLGVIAGLPDGTFAGEKPITRAEFVVLLTRMLGLDVPDTKGKPHAYKDTGETDTWAYAQIDALDSVGVLNGVGGGSFAPNRPITRVEAAAFLARILRDGVDSVSLLNLRPSDVREDYWGYASILRAVNGGEPKTP